MISVLVPGTLQQALVISLIEPGTLGQALLISVLISAIRVEELTASHSCYRGTCQKTHKTYIISDGS